MPFTTSGSTPAGSLENVRFIGIRYLDGFCLPGYYIGLYATNDAYRDAVVTVFVPTELGAPTGTVAASAWLGSDSQQSTNQVTFEVIRADVPPPEVVHIAGRFVASDGAWQLAFSIDAQTERDTCI